MQTASKAMVRQSYRRFGAIAGASLTVTQPFLTACRIPDPTFRSHPDRASCHRGRVSCRLLRLVPRPVIRRIRAHPRLVRAALALL